MPKIMIFLRFAVAVEEDLSRLDCLRRGAATIEKKELGVKSSKGAVIKLA